MSKKKHKSRLNEKFRQHIQNENGTAPPEYTDEDTEDALDAALEEWRKSHAACTRSARKTLSRIRLTKQT